MLLPPKVKSVLTPAAIPPNVQMVGLDPNILLQTAAQQSLDPQLAPVNAQKPCVQRFSVLHPSLPFVAYVLMDAPNSMHKLLVVQHTGTREFVLSISLVDLARMLYGETNPQKMAAAVKSLGSLLDLKFVDQHSLHWSGMLSQMPTPDDRCLMSLAVQTSQRVLLLNIQYQQTLLWPTRQPVVWSNSRLNLLQAHVSQDTLGTIPSSNVLPIGPSWFLLGCADGSLKCYDTRQQLVVKSIKGLGKGDWIVHLTAANPYLSSSLGEGNSGVRRILTLTQRGIGYLIEVAVEDGHLEIKPPLARFTGGAPEATSEDVLEHSLLVYDAHRDWILWMQPKQKLICMWNLSSLQVEFVQNTGSKSLFKPDPTLTITIPLESAWTAAPALIHPAFGDDVVGVAVVTVTGDVHIMCALPHPHMPVSSATATPVCLLPLPLMVQRDAHLDHIPLLKAHALLVRPLLRPATICVATNMGLIMLDFPVAMPGSRHFHFGAGLGSLGKSILSVQQSNVVYGSLDLLKPNPVGRMVAKNPHIVYESPQAVHLPTELQKRPFRTAPQFLSSPSGMYICLLWMGEFRYEILHVASLLAKIGKRSEAPTARNALVASGHGVMGFAWVGDDDTYALLHAPDLVQDGIDFVMPIKENTDASGQFTTNILGTAKQLAKIAESTTKAATSSITAATSATKSATKAATSSASKVVKSTNKGLKKSFGLFGKKKKSGDDNIFTEDDTEEASTMSVPVTPAAGVGFPESDALFKTPDPKAQAKRRFVELRHLVAVEASSGSTTAATSSNIGEIQLRGGNRNPPTALFGGPVLCVASRSAEDPEGRAFFYTRKSEEKDIHAKLYVTSGPTLAYPDCCTWDDDGRICAVVVQNRVAVYLSDSPAFILLGTAHIGATVDDVVTNVKFVHGTMFCCTWNAVHCVFLGDVDGGSTICHFDAFVLASTNVSSIGDFFAASEAYKSLSPAAVALPMVHPVILGFQSGSLLVSTNRGVQSIPLSHPLVRIGTLLASGQVDRAIKWFDAIPDHDNEGLARFLERRGFYQLALDLSHLSLETMVDMSMRYDEVEKLEELVESYGAKGLRAIDLSRGLAPSILGPGSNQVSVVVSVGAFLLGHGNVELARRLTSECLQIGDDGKKDAFMLATLMLSVDEADANRLIRRAVEEGEHDEEWMIGNYIREFAFHD